MNTNQRPNNTNNPGPEGPTLAILFAATCLGAVICAGAELVDTTSDTEIVARIGPSGAVKMLHAARIIAAPAYHTTRRLRRAGRPR